MQPINRIVASKKRHLQLPLLKYIMEITKNETLSIFGENQNNATLVQKFIYCERNIHMEVFTIIALPQEQLQLKQTLALFAEHICWSVTQYRPSVLQNHWSRKDAFSLPVSYTHLTLPTIYSV